MIKIFLDSSNIEDIKKWIDKVDGVTTNHSLMKKAGIKDYEKFAKEVLEIIGDKPVSFEVIADDFDEMERQAIKIASWGENIYVKIPVINTRRENSRELIDKLLHKPYEIKLNITAIMNLEQVQKLEDTFWGDTPAILSLFAGRVADTGKNPIDVIKKAKYYLPSTYLLWASPREVLNIYQAEQAGADIITCTPELLEKYEKFKGMDLNELSLLTVKQFYEDGKESGLTL